MNNGNTVTGLYIAYFFDDEEKEQDIIELLYTLPGDRTVADFDQEYGKDNIENAAQIFADKYNCEEVELLAEIYEFGKLPY